MPIALAPSPNVSRWDLLYSGYSVDIIIILMEVENTTWSHHGNMVVPMNIIKDCRWIVELTINQESKIE